MVRFKIAGAVLLMLAINVASQDTNQTKILKSGVAQWNIFPIDTPPRVDTHGLTPVALC
jgi:hypothetical protein